MRASFCTAVAILFTVAGCDSLAHEPSGTNEVTVNPTPAPLTVDLASAPDTLGLWGTVELQPGFENADGRAIRRIEVLLDDTIVATRDAPGAIFFWTGRVPDGTYELRVRAYAESGTGSLADVYGREEVAGETARVAVIDNAPPTPVVVTSIVPEDGQLVVRWERYSRRNFQRYEVYREDESRTPILVATITDADSTAWPDPTFIGGTARFFVHVVARDQVAHGERSVKSFPAPAFVSSEVVSPTTIRLSWTPTSFPKALGAYVVTRTGPSGAPSTSVVRMRETDPASTTLLDDLPNIFGALYSYTLRTEGRVAGSHVVSDSFGASFDASVEGVTNVYGMSAASGAFVAGAGLVSTVRLDPETFEIDARLDVDFFNLTVSPSGLALGISRFSPTRLIDVASFTTIHSFDLSGPLGPFAYPSSLSSGPATLTEDGVLVSSYVEFRRPSTYDGLGLVALDGRRGQLVARLDAEGRRPPGINLDYDEIHLVTASPDGRFAIAEVSSVGYVLYEQTGNEFVRIAILGPRSQFGGAAFIGPDRVAVSDREAGAVRLLSIPSLQEQRRFAAPAFNGLAFDVGSGLVHGSLGANSEEGISTYAGYDPASGEEVFRVATYRQPRLYGGVLWIGPVYRRVAPRVVR